MCGSLPMGILSTVCGFLYSSSTWKTSQEVKKGSTNRMLKEASSLLLEVQQFKA